MSADDAMAPVRASAGTIARPTHRSMWSRSRAARPPAACARPQRRRPERSRSMRRRRERRPPRPLPGRSTPTIRHPCQARRYCRAVPCSAMTKPPPRARQLPPLRSAATTGSAPSARNSGMRQSCVSLEPPTRAERACPAGELTPRCECRLPHRNLWRAREPMCCRIGVGGFTHDEREPRFARRSGGRDHPHSGNAARRTCLSDPSVRSVGRYAALRGRCSSACSSISAAA